MDEPDLNQFSKADLEVYDFPGTDAALVFVPDGQSPSEPVRQVLDKAGQQRWYPVPGGHNAKIPWHRANGAESLFTREAKGWDHEHCDFCNASVHIGDRCWTTDSGSGGIWLFCKLCYDKLRDS